MTVWASVTGMTPVHLMPILSLAVEVSSQLFYGFGCSQGSPFTSALNSSCLPQGR
jgi:hypothetical protein